jgi:biotin synthase
LYQDIIYHTVTVGAAWRDVGETKDRKAFSSVLEMVRQVSGMGLEVCCTLGMLTLDQAKQLKDAGLTAYNHNLDTSREFYPQVKRSLWWLFYLW